MVRVVSGGKLLGIQKMDDILPVDLDPAQAKAFTPGSIDGNVGLGLLVAEAARRQFGIPFVTEVRFVFKDYDGVVLGLIKPVRTSEAASAAGTADSHGHLEVVTQSKAYQLRLLKNAPRLRGLRKEFEDAGIPLREDQWYFCKAELVKDSEEGYVVALDWTHVKIEPRDILKERRQAAEARKRRKEQKKLQSQGGVANKSIDVKHAPAADPSESSDETEE